MQTTFTKVTPQQNWIQSNLGLAVRGLRSWQPRQIIIAGVTAILFAVLIGVATVLIPNPWFTRDIAPTWWSYPVWIITSILSGMLLATYVSNTSPKSSEATERHTSTMGMAGGVLAWFAVGCPVCNKIALLALGYSGAITWFTPIQPFLALGAMLLTATALLWRLKGLIACSVVPKEVVAA